MLNLDTMLAKHADVACRTAVNGHAIAIRPSAGQTVPTLMLFNETGTLIWDWLDCQTSVREILSRLAGRFPSAPAPQREADALAFLQELCDAGLAVRQAEA